MKKLDINGMKFGRLTAIKELPGRKNGLVRWLCKCECGNDKEAYVKTLRNGGTRSCGCLHNETSMEKVKELHRKYSKPIGSERMHQGYVSVKTGVGWKRRHIFVLEKYLGRELADGEIGHHCDGNKTNDNIDNIELMLNGEHTKLHHTGLKRSQETRRKISEFAKARTISNGHTGIKLNKDNVIEIKKLLSDGLPYSVIADMFFVTKGTIAAIKQKRIWRNV